MDVKGYGGRVSFDGTTVTLSKRGRGETRFNAERVQAVEFSRAGFGMRAIRFVLAGTEAVQSGRSVIGDHRSFAVDPYALTFRKRREPLFRELRNAVEEAKSEAGQRY